MKQTIRIVLVGLVACLMSQATFAQYAANTSLLANTEQTTFLRDGQRLTNVGKTVDGTYGRYSEYYHGYQW